MMRKSILILFLTLAIVVQGYAAQRLSKEKGKEEMSFNMQCEQIYHSLRLENIVSYRAFRQAYDGYLKIASKRREVLTIIDFSKPSTAKRLCVIDMKSKKLLYSSVVAHGRNSGKVYATSFSNKIGSKKSSLGFYITENTYKGRNGYSLILEGLEKGINDNAKQRAIVVHGARYANPAICNDRLGRSFGCPAIPTYLSRPIIDAIKDGSIMYIYGNSPSYIAHSKYVSEQDFNKGDIQS